MQLYHRLSTDIIQVINRSFFDAQHGRVNLSLQRLRDLDEEFPNDAQIAYHEGLIRMQFLGQGLAARELFEKAYTLDNKHHYAAFNATKFARNEKEFHKWAKISLKAAPREPSINGFVNQIEALLSVNKYCDILMSESADSQGNTLSSTMVNELGHSAALMEVVLTTEDRQLDNEAMIRRIRAEKLRNLDKIAQTELDTIMETFQPEDRLALKEAVIEIDKAINLDEYDPILLNLKSAWCYLLGRNEEAIQYANRSLSLRPYNYPQPYINKANASWHLNLDTDALTYAKEALRQAENCQSEKEITQAKDIVKQYSIPRKIQEEQRGKLIIKNTIESILKGAYMTSKIEIGQWQGTISKLVDGLLRRASIFGDDWNMGYIVIMAELLSWFTPETALCIISEVGKRKERVRVWCLNGMIYVVVHSDGVQQHDAA